MAFTFTKFILENLSIIVSLTFVLASICMFFENKKVNSISFLLPAVMSALVGFTAVFELTIITEAQEAVLTNIRNSYVYDFKTTTISALIYLFVMFYFLGKRSKPEELEE